MRRRAAGAVWFCGLLSACQGAGEPATTEPPQDEMVEVEPPEMEPIAPPEPLKPVELPVAIDSRPVVTAAAPPLPISGGTLLVSRDSSLVVMSDPDRDRLSIVSLGSDTLQATVALEPGDEPGRLVEDDKRRVHVVLRRAGAIASIALDDPTQVTRTAVCTAPRGIEHDAAASALIVACASGEVMSMALDQGESRVVARLGTDLRDVARVGDWTLVTRFRSAELLSADQPPEVYPPQRPATLRALFGEPSTAALKVDTLSPQVAYRLRADDQGGLLLSQVERDGEIDLSKPDGASVPTTSTSPYGSVGGCSGVVQAQLSLIDRDGAIVTSRRIPGVLLVDVARDPETGMIAVAQAGMSDGNPELAFQGTFVGSQQASVSLFVAGLGSGSMALPPDDCLLPTRAFSPSGQITAVGFAPGGRIVAQSREPALLAVIDRETGSVQEIDLEGESIADTGHDLFHRDAGRGIACASCHAEGGHDGHTWRFTNMGDRRTQSLDVGLAGSAPFHWAGDERDFSALLDDVMVKRMGGMRQTPERGAALEQWIYALQAPPPPRAANDEAALRGRALFEGSAECSGCHSGERLSNNETRDVGKGEALQVPSLIGIAYRRPLMHDGCAEDLRARFDQVCGGERHGKTAGLSAAQIDDLVAYLETL